MNDSSPSESAGLRACDILVSCNQTDLSTLRHKEAQDVIVRAGNSFNLKIQRYGKTYRACHNGWQNANVLYFMENGCILPFIVAGSV